MRHSTSILKALGLPLAMWLAAQSPAIAHEEPAEAANRQVVLDFYKALNDADAAGRTKELIPAIAVKYLGADYVQHSEMFASLPGPGSVRDKLVRMFQNMPAMKGMPAPKVVSVMAQGDLVMMLTVRQLPDPASGLLKPAYIFNMFRVKDGQLVEHWDVGSMPPPMPPSMSGPGAPAGCPKAP